MKKITLILFALFTCWQINAQVSSYAFSQSSGTYTSITGGTVVLSGSALDANNAAVTLPVTFPFNGSNINSVSVRTDGYLVLGTATTGSTAPISSTMTATGIISAFGCDLMDANAAGTIPEVRWEQIGDEIIFQWNDFARYTSSTSVEIFDFQIRLNTINGKIDIVYNDFSSTSTSTTYTPQVGLRGSANTDYNARRLTTSVPDATPSWDDTAVATSNAHNVRFTSTSPAAFPSTGLTFTWTPPVPCSGAPVAGTVTPAQQNICSGATPANLVATGFSSGVTGLTFQWEESDDDGATDAWTAVTGGTGDTTATYTPAAFSGTPIYYRLNVTCSNSTTSAQTASVLVATPLAPTTQTSLVTIPVASVSYNRAVINWTNGNGPRRVVYISDSATFTDPVNGNTAALVANSVYSGSGQQIILDGTGSTVTVTGLAIGTQYYVKSYEYLRCGSGPYDYYYNVTTGSNIGNFTTCGAYTVPATEDFTTYVPGCWQEADNGDLVAGPATFGTSSWSADGFGQVGTTGAFNYNIFTTGANDWVLSPLYSIPATGWELKFDAAANDYDTTDAPTIPWEADDFVEVLVSTATSNWTVLYTYNNTNVPSNTGTPNIIDLDAYSGQTVRFAFRAVEGTSNGSADIDFSIDNFELRQTPSCIEPTGLVVSNIASTGATISWNAVNPAPSTGYEYYYSNVNTAPSVAGTAINALTDNLSGLTPNTTYYVWLRSDCGSGSFSAWVGPVTFYTGYCTPSSTTSDSYVDNFSTSGGSQNISNLTSGFTAGGYLNATSQVVESYENGSFDFNATIQGPTVGFAIWIDWNNNLVFEASEKVYNTTSYGSGPFSGTITVPVGTALGDYRMRITTDWNASNPSNPCAAANRAEFEDYTLTVGAQPACLPPNTIIASNITSSSVDLSWTDGSGGQQFDYEYVIQAPGTGEPTGAGAQIGDVTVVGEGFDIDGNPLMPNTTYEVYVRADCGGSFSTWAGPISFTTLCEAFSVPFSEGFNSTSTTESCWTKLNVNADGVEWNTNYTTNPFEGDQVAVIYTDFNGGANDDWLISPTITLTGNQRLKFHYRVQSAGEPNDFELLLSTTGNTPASFTNTLIANTSYSNITYVEQIVDLSAYSGDVNIAWHVPNGGLDGWRLYIDNVIVEDIPLTPPSCATNILGTPDANCGNFANSITWDATPLADGYYVTIGTSSGANDIADSVSLPSSTLTYSFTGTMNTTYYYTIIPFNANGSATGCTEQSFTTNANGCYCVSEPTSVDGTGITNVQVVATDFPNTVSAAPVYNDHTANVVDMFRGINNNVQITFNTDSFGTSYDYNTVIWIDVNDNFTFEPSEIVFTGVSAAVSPTILNASFVMPGTAPLGQHRMRIVATDNLQTPSNPCYSGSYGETADFTINVVAPTCTPPAATTSVVYDCSASQFSVAVNVSALGNGSPSISNGTTTWPVTATGVVNAGPFNFGTPVTLTLLHGTDASCNLPLGIFNYGGCPPVNDDCDNAVALTVNTDLACSVVTPGTTLYATNSGIEPTFTVSGTPDNDVWFSFIATGPAHRVSLSNVVAVSGSSTDMGMAVFDGSASCNALVLVGSSDPNTYNLTGLTAGVTYYVSVYGWGSGPGAQATFDICVGTPPAPPANDNCANAIAISAMPYTNSQDASSATGPVVSTCTGMNDGVWYTVVGNGGNIIIDVTAVTGWDPELGVYTGSCGTFTCVASIDEGGASDGETYTIVSSTLGTTYYINVGHYSSFSNSPEGPFTIGVTTTLSSGSFDNNSFVAYPNPVKDIFNVSYSSEISAVRVLNLLGQEVISQEVNTTSAQIDMSQLSTGTYIVNVTVGDAIKVIKVVKQ